MQIVIDIPDTVWNKAMEYGHLDICGIELSEKVMNGTQLPKGCNIQRIIPKRADVQKWIYTKCPNPNCDYELSTHHGDGYYSIEHKPNFCPNCGQALLWEGEG